MPEDFRTLEEAPLDMSLPIVSTLHSRILRYIYKHMTRERALRAEGLPACASTAIYQIQLEMKNDATGKPYTYHHMRRQLLELEGMGYITLIPRLNKKYAWLLPLGLKVLKRNLSEREKND